jgi:hypothetical protein
MHKGVPHPNDEKKRRAKIGLPTGKKSDESLWNKVSKGINVAKRQGFKAAFNLATTGSAPSESNKSFFEEIRVRDLKPEYEKKQQELDDFLGGMTTEEADKWLGSPVGKKRFDEAHDYGEAYSRSYDAKIYDDDMFTWSSLTGRTDEYEMPGGLEKGIMMPTRPGSVARKEEGERYIRGQSNREYVPLSDDIPGGWLTPDKDRGLVFTEDEQPTSIDRFKKVWSEGDDLSKSFRSLSNYNLLFEDETGDVSIIQTHDHKRGDKLIDRIKNREGGYRDIEGDAVFDMINRLKPKNIYYMDAGQNQAFYKTGKESSFQEGDWSPYTYTTTMMGAWRGKN